MTEVFVEYEPSDRDAVLRLLRNQPFKEVLWTWQFLENPRGAERNPLILLKIDGALAGFNGTMPVRLRIDGRVTDGIWSCDTFIDDAWRGKGLGKRLFAAVEAHAPIVLGFGISDMAYPLLTEKRGWLPSSAVDVFFFQRRIGSWRDAVKRVAQWRGLLAPRPDPRLAVTVSPAAELPRDVDDLWARVESGYQRAVVRDYAYLHWKYGQHPMQPYTAIAIRDGGVLVALGIIRASRDEARLVDYVGPRHAAALKNRLLHEFAALTPDATRLSVSTSDDEWKACLHAHGYRRFGAPERFAIWTTEPMERPADGWFIMRGDSDGDLLDACK